jgi:hypothetical protein
MALIFYAIIPRAILIITGIIAQKRSLQNFNFKKPRFRQVIIRMQSPVVDIDADKKIDNNHQTVQKSNKTVLQIKKKVEHPTPTPTTKEKTDQIKMPPGQTALLLASTTAYNEDVIKTIIHKIKEQMFFDVGHRAGIQFDFENDTEALNLLSKDNLDPIILLHEVWQPPIRGLLYYIQQIRSSMPDNKTMWILLTQDSGQENLCVDDSDINFEVWKNAVVKLKQPGILIKRFVS